MAPSTDKAPPPLESLARYGPRWRARLARFGARSRANSDLLTSFPAACVVIADRDTAAKRRQEALKLVAAGAKLKTIAIALQLPFWLRRLPPEALHEPISAWLRARREDAPFGRVITGAIPNIAEPGSPWLGNLVAARILGGDRFAAWFAHRVNIGHERLSPADVAAIASHAWASEAERTMRNEDSLVSAITTPWRPEQSVHAAALAAQDWHFRVLATCTRQPTMTAADALTYVHLTTAEALCDEGRAMKHCVGGYATSVALGLCAIVSVRRGDERLATVEIVPGPGGALGRVVQIKGPSNSTPDAVVTAAIEQWWRRVETDHAHGFSGAFDQARWREIWAPYWRACGLTAQASDVDPRRLATGLTRCLQRLVRLAR